MAHMRRREGSDLPAQERLLARLRADCGKPHLASEASIAP